MKTLDNLYSKALKQGFARVNGRIVEYDFGQVYKGDLQEKYSIKMNGDILTFKHWGTVTLVANIERCELIKWYGESVSDRDSLNYMLNKLNIDGRFHYYPSKLEFTYENN